MKSEREYLKASPYDLTAQWHNSRVFHRELVVRPWLGLACATGMSLLGATAGFNLVDAPQWDRHPWIGWLLGEVASLVDCYFLLWAARVGGMLPQS